MFSACRTVPFFAVAALLLAGTQVAAVQAAWAETATAQSGDVIRVGDLTLEFAWSRATAPTAKVAAGYLLIRNDGDAPDRLIGGEADFAGRVEVHTMAMDSGVMRMRELEDGLEIPPGDAVELRPGAEHVMFLALEVPLVEGEARETVLMFEKAGPARVVFDVAAPGAMGPGGTN